MKLTQTNNKLIDSN